MGTLSAAYGSARDSSHPAGTLGILKIFAMSPWISSRSLLLWGTTASCTISDLALYTYVYRVVSFFHRPRFFHLAFREAFEHGVCSGSALAETMGGYYKSDVGKGKMVSYFLLNSSSKLIAKKVEWAVVFAL